MMKLRISLTDFSTPERIAGFEGGATYIADEDGTFFLIINQTTLFDLLNEDDREGIQPIKVLEFPSDAERQQYADAHGWVQTRDLTWEQ